MKNDTNKIKTKINKDNEFLISISLLLFFGTPFLYFASLLLNHVFFPSVIQVRLDLFTLYRLIDFAFFSISPIAVYLSFIFIYLFKQKVAKDDFKVSIFFGRIIVILLSIFMILDTCSVISRGKYMSTYNALNCSSCESKIVPF